MKAALYFPSRRLPTLLILSVAGLLSQLQRGDRVAAGGKESGGVQVAMNALGRDGGARYGEWSIWRYDGGDRATFFIHEPTRHAIYMPWISNGWINFRDDAGNWFVVYRATGVEPQNRDDLPLAKYLSRRRPDRELSTGEVRFLKWRVTIAADRIEMRGEDFGDTIVIRKDSGVFTHNGRAMGKKSLPK